VIYSLTEPAIELVPIMAALGTWGTKWLPVTEELSIRARLLGDGSSELWERFMAELREEHLGIPAGPSPGGHTVREILHEASVEVAASTRGAAPGSS